MRARASTTGIVIGVVLTLLSACGKQGCSNLPVRSGIQIQVPPAIGKIARTLRVELCQGHNHCEAVNFSAGTTDPAGTIAKGITLDGDAYDLDLARLGTGWKASTPAGLTVIGTTKSGRIVLKHTEQFTFVAAYPNGQDCDDVPSLTYSTSVGGADLVS